MPKIVVTHGVVDVDTWLQFKSERADAIAALGSSNVVDHVAQDGSNTVAVATEVDDVAGMMAALSSPPPEVGGHHGRYGVIPPLAIYVDQWPVGGDPGRRLDFADLKTTWGTLTRSGRSAPGPSPRSDCVTENAGFRVPQVRRLRACTNVLPAWLRTVGPTAQRGTQAWTVPLAPAQSL
jgi:hypothetical protein